MAGFCIRSMFLECFPFAFLLTPLAHTILGDEDGFEIIMLADWALGVCPFAPGSDIVFWKMVYGENLVQISFGMMQHMKSLTEMSFKFNHCIIINR